MRIGDFAFAGAEGIARSFRQAIFQNPEVRLGGREVDVHGGRERPHRVVRRDRHVMGLRQSRDLAHLQQSADHADIGLDDVASLHLKQPQKLEPAEQRLAGRQRAVQPALEFAPGFEILRPQRLFEEQRVIWRQRVAELSRLRHLENLGMGIEGDLVIGADGLAQLAEVFRCGAHHLAPAMAVDIDPIGAELERRHAALRIEPVEFVARRRRIGGGVDTRIDPHPVAHVAAEQPIDRHVQGFRRNVPQALIDRRDRRQHERARRKARLLHQQQDQVLDPARIVPANEIEQVIQDRRQRLVGTVIVAFAPADQPVIRVDRHDDPGPVFVARHEGAQPLDFHLVFHPN